MPAAVRSNLKIGVRDLSLSPYSRLKRRQQTTKFNLKKNKKKNIKLWCHTGGDADGGGGERKKGGATATLAGGAGQAKGGDDRAAETREAAAESGEEAR